MDVLFLRASFSRFSGWVFLTGECLTPQPIPPSPRSNFNADGPLNAFITEIPQGRTMVWVIGLHNNMRLKEDSMTGRGAGADI